MPLNVQRELVRLRRLGPTELREIYADLYGEPTRSGNKDYLVKRIVWRLQAREQGTLPERARRYALEIADDADLNLRPRNPRNPRNPRKGPRPRKDGNADTIPSPPLRLTDTQSSVPEPLRLPKRHHDPRLPLPGGTIVREYKGRTHEVTVLENGFEYDGEHYRSLTAVAKQITGTHWNGFGFFNLSQEATR